MNKVILSGRLVANPDLRTTTSDISVVSFTIAVKRKGKKDETDFFNCVAWRQTAEFIQKYFVKGKEILIDGSIQIQKYEDKAGEKKYITQIIADNVEFCGKKELQEQTEKKAFIPSDYIDILEDESKDLPF